jgi:hypothetical protein
MEKSELHEVARLRFEEFEQTSVLPVLALIKNIYHQWCATGVVKTTVDSSDQILQHLWFYWKEADTAYENDNSTQCPATRYHALCSVAINRPIEDAWTEKRRWYHGCNQSVISFYSELLLRDHDSRVVLAHCSLEISPYMVKPDVKHNAASVSYTTNDTKMKFHENEIGMLRLFKLIKECIEDRDLHLQIKQAMG